MMANFAAAGVEVEIIDFYRPDDNTRNVYFTGMPSSMSEQDTNFHLHERCLQYGLVYEVQVIQNYCSNFEKRQEQKAELFIQVDIPKACVESHSGAFSDRNKDGSGITIAFVKFYSSRCAHAAVKGLQRQLYQSGSDIKVRLATRKKFPAQHVLYYNKCYELANYYLGFNGWTLSVISCEQVKQDQSSLVQFRCVVKLDIVRHGVTTTGIGLSSQTTPTDNRHSDVRITRDNGRLQKQSHQLAVQNAFCKIVLAVLGNGQVFVDERPLTPPEVAELLPVGLVESQTLQINMLDVEPDSGTDSEDDQFGHDEISEALGLDSVEQSNLDAQNRQILAELLMNDSVYDPN